MSEGAKNCKIHFDATVSMSTVLKFQLIYLLNANQNSQLASQIRIFFSLNDRFPLKCNV